MSDKTNKEGKFTGTVEDFISRFKEHSTSLLKKTTLMTGALTIAAAPLFTACNLEQSESELLGSSTQSIESKDWVDWAQREGERNTYMVHYGDASWYNYTECGGRFCSGVEIFLKVFVRPAAYANLDYKKVGIEYREMTGAPKTAMGNYFDTLEDGREEWHVRVWKRRWENSIFTFNSWYQDGRGNTYYDDNKGELYPLSYQGNYSILRQEYGDDYGPVVDDYGVSGKVSLIVADLDFDKEIQMVCSTDGWETAQWFSINHSAGKNEWYWEADLWGDYERWIIDLDLPGDVDKFEYAIVYKHGTSNEAKQYSFWDNNYGKNYIVEKEVE